MSSIHHMTRHGDCREMCGTIEDPFQQTVHPSYPHSIHEFAASILSSIIWHVVVVVVLLLLWLCSIRFGKRRKIASVFCIMILSLHKQPTVFKLTDNTTGRWCCVRFQQKRCRDRGNMTWCCCCCCCCVVYCCVALLLLLLNLLLLVVVVVVVVVDVLLLDIPL